MNTTPLESRERGAPINIGAISLSGGTIGFALVDDRTVAFSTPDSAPITLLGLRLRPRGQIILNTHSLSAMRVNIVELDPIDGDDAWLNRDDRIFERYFKDTEGAIERVVFKAAARLAIEHEDQFAQAMAEKLDDIALEALKSIALWEAKLLEGGSFKDVRIYEDLLDTDYRKLAGIDEACCQHHASMRTRAGYVAMEGERPLRKPEDYGRRPKGLLGSIFHRHHVEARQTLKKAGNDRARIVRVRLVDGALWEVTPEGLAVLKIALDAPIHTGTLQAAE